MQLEQGNRSSFTQIRGAEGAIPDVQYFDNNVNNSEVGSSKSSNCHPYDNQITSGIADTTTLNGCQVLEHDDAESVHNHQQSSGLNDFLTLLPPVMQTLKDGHSVPYYPVPLSNNYQGQVSAIDETDFASVTHRDKGKNIVTGSLSCLPERAGRLEFPSWKDINENITRAQEGVGVFQPSFCRAQFLTQMLLHMEIYWDKV